MPHTAPESAPETALPGGFESVETLIRARLDTLTRAERQLADALLDNFPVSGLGSVTAVAEAAGVSAPTAVRTARKLGFEGFGDFQDALRRELAARVSGPIAKRDHWSAAAPDSHILNRFAEAVTDNIRRTLAGLDPAEFDAAARLLAAHGNRVFIAGGRITRSLADYLFNHLQVIRPNVTQLGTAPGVWPHYLLDTGPGDVVVIFDIRRYENVLLRLAQLAADRGARVVLFTDQWGSPVSKVATHRFACRVEAPSAWDSNVAILLVLEALVAAVQEQDWQNARRRMEELEGIFDETRLFRKFV